MDSVIKRNSLIALAFILIALAALQFVPVARTNRLGAGDPQAPRDVQWLLRRACYDCHSTETRWPVWAYVAPMSWLVVRDVDRARAILNFSDWASFDHARRVTLRSVIGPTTATHRMPMWYYVTLHPDAHISAKDIKTLKKWSETAASEP